MTVTKFYDDTIILDHRIKYAVIVSRFQGQWVFCKHKNRDTYECPGGHREAGETAEEAARRELWEETGAEVFDLIPICAYSVTESEHAADQAEESFGMLYYAEIRAFGELPPMEIEKVEWFDSLPENWTYPQIQPELLKKAATFMIEQQLI